MALYFLADLTWLLLDRQGYVTPSIGYPDIVAGRGNAPEQYRILIADTAQFLCNHIHFLHLTQVFLAFDCLFVMATSVLLYILLSRELQSSPPSIAVAARAFLGFWMAFFLHWTFIQTRAETSACILYAVLALFLCQSIQRARSTASRTLAAAAFILLSFLQGWVRADVAVIFSAAVACACLWPSPNSTPRLRLWLFTSASIAALTAAATLEFIQHILYPQARRGGKAFVLMDNLSPSDWRGISIFLLIALPCCWLLLQLLRRFRSLPLLDRALLLASSTYLVLWSCMGLWPEARIFVPFAFTLCPLLAVASTHFFLRLQPHP
jgi:hypothetical protein